MDHRKPVRRRENCLIAPQSSSRGNSGAGGAPLCSALTAYSRLYKTRGTKGYCRRPADNQQQQADGLLAAQHARSVVPPLNRSRLQDGPGISMVLLVSLSESLTLCSGQPGAPPAVRVPFYTGSAPHVIHLCLRQGPAYQGPSCQWYTRSE